MAPGNGRRRQVASRHLVCASCSSWIQFDSSGCDTAWAETREGSFTFTCKGCKRVEFLVRELAELREMLVSLKRAVTGHGLEGKEGEAGDREVGLEEQEKGEGFLAPDEREVRTEEEGRYVLGQRLWQPTHIRGNLRAL